MSRKLAITEHQARVLFRAANKENGIVEIEILDATIRIIPGHIYQGAKERKPSTAPDEFGSFEEYKSWHDAVGKKPTPASMARNVTDFSELGPRPILADGYMWEYSEFQAYVLARPLNKREKDALKALSAFDVGQALTWREFSLGPSTQDRLEARGYIEVQPHPKFPDRTGAIVLTPAGRKAWLDSQ